MYEFDHNIITFLAEMVELGEDAPGKGRAV
jgi:hypothetical protein